LPPDTPQGVADALGYLQHYLHELTERQNVSENNINTVRGLLIHDSGARSSPLE